MSKRMQVVIIMMIGIGLTMRADSIPAFEFPEEYRFDFCAHYADPVRNREAVERHKSNDSRTPLIRHQIRLSECPSKSQIGEDQIAKANNRISLLDELQDRWVKADLGCIDFNECLWKSATRSW